MRHPEGKHPPEIWILRQGEHMRATHNSYRRNALAARRVAPCQEGRYRKIALTAIIPDQPVVSISMPSSFDTVRRWFHVID
jgi:hypothetical protein